jgi:hypothetical protein
MAEALAKYIVVLMGLVALRAPDVEAQKTFSRIWTSVDDCQPHRCSACPFDKRAMDCGAASRTGIRDHKSICPLAPSAAVESHHIKCRVCRFFSADRRNRVSLKSGPRGSHLVGRMGEKLLDEQCTKDLNGLDLTRPRMRSRLKKTKKKEGGG